MGVLRNNNGLRGGAARSRLIIGLMALILALVLGMAWQANRSVQAHNATAIGVLQDYGRLAYRAMTVILLLGMAISAFKFREVPEASPLPAR